jgi:hypothetical protein
MDYFTEVIESEGLKGLPAGSSGVMGVGLIVGGVGGSSGMNTLLSTSLDPSGLLGFGADSGGDVKAFFFFFDGEEWVLDNCSMALILASGANWLEFQPWLLLNSCQGFKLGWFPDLSDALS